MQCSKIIVNHSDIAKASLQKVSETWEKIIAYQIIEQSPIQNPITKYHWTKPQNNHYKLNADISFDTDTNTTRIGYALRNDTSVFISEGIDRR